MSCKVGDKVAIQVAHTDLPFCPSFVGLFDAGGQSHTTVYPLHRFMLGIFYKTVSRAGFAKSSAQEMHNIVQRGLGTIL